MCEAAAAGASAAAEKLPSLQFLSTECNLTELPPLPLLETQNGLERKSRLASPRGRRNMQGIPKRRAGASAARDSVPRARQGLLLPALPSHRQKRSQAKRGSSSCVTQRRHTDGDAPANLEAPPLVPSDLRVEGTAVGGGHVRPAPSNGRFPLRDFFFSQNHPN